MKVALICAMADNRVIGKDNQTPWHLPNDMKHFKEVTMDHPVIMGRKTYESIGRPLPGRRNIVITRQEDLKIEGCDVVHSLEEALELAKGDSPKEIDVIGGEQIYSLALPLADRIYLTIVHADIEGDAYFPEFSEEEWVGVEREEHPSDEDHPYAFTFVTYTRKP